MKKVFIVTFLILIFVSLASQETWIITSLNWQPYAGAELTNQGNSIQDLRELLAKKNIKLIVEFYPWKRAQTLAKTEKYVGFFPAWPEEVGAGFTASGAVDWSEIAIMKESNTEINFNSLEDLFKNYKVGIIDTYVYPQKIQELVEKYPQNIDKAPNEVALLKKLSKARHHAAITDPSVMLYLAEMEGISNVEQIGEIIEKKALVVAFRDGADNAKRMKILSELLK
jgi:polar amino acid transport system substrate-binding protein